MKEEICFTIFLSVIDGRAIYVFDCENKPLKGRFVSVKSVNVKQPLVLCEVKVRGYLWTCERYLINISTILIA